MINVAKDKELVFPFILECCKFCKDDTFWSNVFFELAHSKPPYGCYISKNYLTCSYNKKEFSYQIVEKDARQLYDEIYFLLTNKLGLMSSAEKVKKKIEFTSTEFNIKSSRQNWGTIRKKNIKELLVEKYVISMKKTHKLSLKQSRYLLSLIFMAIAFKVISNKDIECEDCRISHINGIDFHNRTIVLSKNLYGLYEKQPSIFIDRISMSDNWENYLRESRKTIF
jgi:hypothetical protein